MNGTFDCIQKTVTSRLITTRSITLLTLGSLALIALVVVGISNLRPIKEVPDSQPSEEYSYADIYNSTALITLDKYKSSCENVGIIKYCPIVVCVYRLFHVLYSAKNAFMNPDTEINAISPDDNLTLDQTTDKTTCYYRSIRPLTDTNSNGSLLSACDQLLNKLLVGGLFALNIIWSNDIDRIWCYLSCYFRDLI